MKNFRTNKLFRINSIIAFKLFLTGCTHISLTNNKQSEFQYSEDWTSPHSAQWEKIFQEMKGRPELKLLEIGVFEGRSLIWMFDNILTHPTSSAVALDPFVDKSEEVYYSNIKLAGISNRVKTIKGYSQKIIRELPLDHFDIVYVDGSHEKSDVLSDAVQSWETMKIGGVMIFDDYLLDETRFPSPKLAVDCFVSIYKDKLEILHKDYQLSVKKLR